MHSVCVCVCVLEMETNSGAYSGKQVNKDAFDILMAYYGSVKLDNHNNGMKGQTEQANLR